MHMVCRGEFCCGRHYDFSGADVAVKNVVCFVTTDYVLLMMNNLDRLCGRWDFAYN